MEELERTSTKLERNKKGQLLPGQSSLNPNGRPKGSISIKDKVRQHLEEHPEAVEEIVKHFVTENRELMWQMLEGRPPQDVTSGGEKLVQVPIYGGLSVQGHNSNEEDIQPQKED